MSISPAERGRKIDRTQSDRAQAGTVVASAGSSPVARSIAGLAIYGALVGLAFAVNYPGRLTPDSLDMLTQAAFPQILNNWHEPAATGFWLVFSPLLGQPASALLSQALMIFIYPAILIERAAARRPVSIASLFGLAAFAGALVYAAGLISKDLPMTGLVLCLLGVFDLQIPRRLRKYRTISVAFLVTGMVLIRPTNILLFGFTAACWIVIRRRPVRTAIPQLVLICAVCAIVPWITKFVDRHVIGAADAKVENALVIFDAAGISSAIHKDLFATLPGWPTAAVLRPWQCYTPDRWDPFRWGDCRQYYAAFIKTGVKPLSWWARIILRHPAGFAIHKMEYAYRLLRYPAAMSTFGTPPAVNTISRLGDLDGSYTEGFDMRGRIQLWKPGPELAPFDRMATLVFSKYVFLVSLFGCMLGFVRAWKAGRDQVDFVEVLAGGIGIGNILMLIMFGAGADARYLLPTYVCGLVVILRRLDRATKSATGLADDENLRSNVARDEHGLLAQSGHDTC